ncbi:membrane-associated protease RseP (regulator of RpoE activity) [Actinomycetospora succinea]|uniref:Membrane-associated protease RseP (Regulator of RpoE activity) n=1 Tax=Actinomycetospora succinea TaxID=663603 RepID=A0A4R6VSK5_9PSEU|nr:site-2 protease family protein [Actinomycetospora succinea]TDQ65604.1 membrane-associated protease RseP (regulator of RpoE activity) [Actinomycetospora succinea]
MLVLGIVLFALGLLLSIAWHELGHYSTARLFGIRVPEFMVGFGPTVLSVKKGETRFGIKAIPLGGYIRMIGMVPPAAGELVGRSRRSGPFQGMVDDVRADSVRDFEPGDEDRQFWTRKPWKRIIVMLAGPFMNLILAVVLFAIVLMGFGVPTAQPVVSAVSECVVPATQTGPGCPPGAVPTPAAQAGFRAGDRIVSFDGRTYPDWESLQRAIRDARGTVPVVVERGGQQLTLYPTLIENQVADLDTPLGEDPRYVTASFLGLTPIEPVMAQSVGQVTDRMGKMLEGSVYAIARLPEKVPALFGAVFLGEEREANGPVSLVGVSVMGGQVLQQERPASVEISIFLNLLAAVNLSLFLLNLLPILPLDGGHVLPALWEAVKKRIARLRGRPDPGPVDLARLMPIGVGFAALIMAYGLLVIVADIVNPIDLGL